MNQSRRDTKKKMQEERHTSSQKYIINRMKNRFMFVFPVFGFLFGRGTLKSFEAEPMIFILVLCALGSLAEFIPHGWEKTSSKEDEKRIDWKGFIQTLVKYGLLFVIGYVIGMIFK